jgi:hypothetical protein
MHHLFFTLTLAFVISPAISQVTAIPKIIRSTESAAEASKAARTAKFGSKVVAADSGATVVSGSEKMISTEMKALIATRTTQIVTSCKSSSTSKGKDLECKKRSDEFQRCIASELDYTSVAKTAIDRCTKLFN